MIGFDFESRFKPLNNGQSCPMAPIGPRPVYCPTANSMNSIGTPQTNKIMKYGIRNIPAKLKICANPKVIISETFIFQMD